ncbi:gliding motility-associated ABC transporter substrate-binding protein GldG [Solitalea canadensis]|uniref:Gliding-associated putative ABC transporter substrate-binding component GldG n=1 Tax=Solitalea canadensis (strain ATCC 29591 / DSM 3403 / JCM 21819 / LMG 8368 / NBRC 15130 / NCIMB 12057 / USAM 9D) TaxID=929556 RepID=H8KNZ8_SOLCM|nr:gliding motility-associated ABC transporter substrate-binding protein GldG [Solitalea canadensis]AFD05520.1 gliding-associated putative ABC transporter substrate-binding component GldG [Solitalea canadensis DSM 3403]
MNNTVKKKSIIQFLAIIAAVFLVNIAGSFYFSRIDFTKEKRYTLSESTKNILTGLENDVVVNVYLEGELPANFKRLKKSTLEMLDEFKAYSKGKIYYNFIDPLGSSSVERQNAMIDTLAKQGLQPTNLMMKTDKGNTQKIIIPGALVYYEGKQLPISLLQNSSRVGGGTQEEAINASIENIEYQLASTVKKLSNKNKALIGFTIGHNEPDDQHLADIGRTLAESYELRRVDLNAVKLIDLQKFKTLVIAKPTKAFSEEEKYKLDQFLVNGGNLFLLLDQLQAETDSIRSRGMSLAYPLSLNLDDMLFRYGARVNYNLVEDVYCARIPVILGEGNQAQQELLPWIFYPMLISNSNHPIVRNLEAVRCQFVNSIDTIGNKNINKTILLTTSPYSRKSNAPVVLSLASVQEEPDPAKFTAGPQTAAVLLEGSFSSVFANRTIEGADLSIPFKTQHKKSKLIIVADGDVITNDVSALDKQIFPLGFDKYTNQTYGNKVFVENSIDYLTDDSGLLTLRTKEIKIRLLDKEVIRNERLKWQLINTILPVAIIVLFAVGRSIYRKRKYAA